MGLFDWIFAKPCKDDEHTWATKTVSGHVVLFCRSCGVGK